MKKTLLFLLFTYKSLLFGQTVLASYSLDLKNYNENNQISNATNNLTKEVFAFIKGDNNITILKYNSSLFLANQFSDSIENIKNRFMIGYSFSEDGNPTTYWATNDYSNIRIAKYYIDNKTSKVLNFNFPYLTQFVIAEFQTNATFYILAKEKFRSNLILYAFKNGTCEINFIDFSSFQFKDEKEKKYTFNTIIQQNPIEKIGAEDYNPLYKVTAKSKAYFFDNKIILTLDYNLKKTQIFEINIDDFDVKEKNILQPITQTPSKTSNSLFYENKLFQIVANKKELLISVKDYDTNQNIKRLAVSKNDTIPFKNSPLLAQTNNRKPRILKNTSNFLRNVSLLDIGL